jgi:hypothetical protein
MDCVADHVGRAFFGLGAPLAWCHSAKGYTPREKGAAVLKLVSTLGADRDFDPETLLILVGAFDDAWKAVETSGAPFASERYAETARQILAKSIIDDATRGQTRSA